MTEGTTLLCSDNKHFVIVAKIFSNQSIIVESKDKQLSFTRLIEYNDVYKGISFGSWINIVYGR
jgi:hypothetical protein